MAGPVISRHSNSCKILHSPSSRQDSSSASNSRSNASDPRRKRVCVECLEVSRYVRKRNKGQENLDEAAKARRQDPSSHFPLKYLSLTSKTKRTRNTRQQRSRLKKQALRFYKTTKIELPGQQSKELCQLIEAIESSEVGKKELDKITADGNKIEGKGGLKAGGCISQIWQKDQESFCKDQRNNGTYQVIFAYQFTRTISEGGLIQVFRSHSLCYFGSLLSSLDRFSTPSAIAVSKLIESAISGV